MKQIVAAMRAFACDNRFVLLVAGGWLLFVWVFVLVGDIVYNQPLALDAWAGSWDGAWYRSIVENGYSAWPLDTQSNVAFFPLFPALVWLVSKITQLPVVWAGMAVSTVSFAGALLCLWHFVSTFFTRKIAAWTVLLVVANPFSLYFGMMYTESLFLLLAVATCWFVYKKQWWWAALFAGLATATRSVGVALAVVVAAGWIADRIMYARHNAPGVQALHSAQKSAPFKVGERQRVRTPWALWLSQTFILMTLAFSGIILFSLFMWHHTGDPFAYRTVQQFWPGRGGLANVGVEVMALFTPTAVNAEYLLAVMWHVAGVIACIGLALVIKMRQWLLALYAGIALSLPVLFGTFTAMNRYMLVAFPIFIGFAAVVAQCPRWLQVALLVLGMAGLGATAILMVDPRAFFIA